MVGHVGELSRRKVVARLVAVARLPGVRLVALGDGSGAATLRSAGAKVITRATGLERARCVASLDLLVQPRKREAFAPAVLEALASGVPVVAYAETATSTSVRHELNGLLVRPDRGARSLARAVERVAADADLRRHLSEQARPSALDHSWEASLRDLVGQHYARALSGPVSLAR